MKSKTKPEPKKSPAKLWPINPDAYNDAQAREIGRGILNWLRGIDEDDEIGGANFVDQAMRLVDAARSFREDPARVDAEWQPMCAYCLNPENQGHMDDCDRPAPGKPEPKKLRYNIVREG